MSYYATAMEGNKARNRAVAVAASILSSGNAAKSRNRFCRASVDEDDDVSDRARFEPLASVRYIIFE
jgi:hypothetical protein